MNRPTDFSSIRAGDRVRVRFNGQEHDVHVVEVRSNCSMDVKVMRTVAEIPYRDFVGLHPPT